MKLIINGTAVQRSSLGARRYFDGVMRHLQWPEGIEVTPPGRSGKWERINDFLIRGSKDALYWSPSHVGPLFARNHIVTVLDCINVQYTFRHDWRLPLLRANLGLLLTNAAVIVTISSATRDAVLECFKVDPDRVFAIGGPTDFREEMRAVPTEVVGGPPFVLMVTNSLPHKNTLRASRALAASSAARRGIRLRVVGSLDPSGIATCAAAGIEVEQHRGISNDMLHLWLTQCRFLFSPSLQEGLNLPIGESLALGGRVLCSDISVHREFYEGAVLFCDPLDEFSMAAMIDEGLSGRDAWRLPGRLRALRSFSDVAGEYRVLFQRVAGGEFSR